MSEAQKQKIGVALSGRRSATKKCPQCGETKDREREFYLKKNRTESWCKTCHRKIANARWRRRSVEERRQINRRITLRRSYGISVEQYEELSAAQNDVCAICGGQETGRLGLLYVDHCHETNVIRGLLCNRCNAAIGLLRDEANLCRTAAEYLVRLRPDALIASPGYPSGRK